MRAQRIAAAVTVSLLASMRAAAVVCGDPFAASPAIPIGRASHAVLTADFNGDQIPDIASLDLDYPNESISILLGNGDLTFQAPIVTALPNEAASFVAGDFNGDSKMDLVVGYSFGGGVTLLGNGDGTFQDPTPFSADVSLSSLVAGYFDADSHLDIAAAGYGVTVLLGLGDGSFAPAVDYPVAPYANGIAAGDLDGDGVLDLAVSHAQDANFLSLLRGHGDGTFEAAIQVVAGTELSNPAIADLDGDGKNDLIVTSAGLIAVLIAKGNLSFQAAQDYAAGPTAIAALPLDIDGDGHVDLVVASVGDDYSAYQASVRVLHNPGNAAFTLAASYAFLSAPTAPAAADFDSDGNPDIVLGSGGGYLVPMRNLGGVLAAPRIVEIAASNALALGDFNEDGYLDVVLSGSGVAFGGPNGTFTEGPPGGWSVSVAAAADFNGDGHVDIAGATTSAFVFVAGNGDGTFQDPILQPFPGPGTVLTGAQVADFNSDGHPDVAFSDYEGYYASGQVTVFLNDGSGGFTNSAAVTTQGGLEAGLAVGDFDGDGHVDIATAGQNVFDETGDLYLLKGRGNGTFDLPTTQPLTSRARTIVAGEFTTPGIVDLVVGENEATVLLPGVGDGGFGPPQTIADLTGDVATAADVDGDGKLDVLLADSSLETFLHGLGGGAFAPPRSYPDSYAAGPVLVGDLDGRGALDTVIGAPSLGLVVIRNARLAAAVASASATVGGPAVLAARAGGLGLLSYQWRRGGMPLSDGGAISGSQTATLTIDPVSFADAGSYDVVVTDSCGTITSNAANLAVEFADVPASSPFHDDIVTIATAGISGGCGGGNYCPASPVRRDQMAVFLLKSEHGSSYTPPACGGVFADVACPSAFADWIEQLAAEGVTGGCGSGNYCPSDSVTRAQMAVFLLKASQGSSYTPPPATGIFADVPVGSFAADFIEDLYDRGITGGCQASPLLYCPANAVLRQQMATFLVRTFSP